jgi:hypothetical protein
MKEIEIKLVPIFEKIEEGKYKKVKEDGEIKDKFKRKMEKDKKKIFRAVYHLDFDRIEYNEKDNIITLIKTPKKEDYKAITYMVLDERKIKKEEDIRRMYINYFTEEIKAGADTWLNSKIIKFGDLYMNLKIKKIKEI